VAVRISGLILLSTLSALMPTRAADAPACKPADYSVRLERRYGKAADGTFPCISGQPVESQLTSLRKEFYRNDTLTKAGAATMLSAWPQIARAQLELRKQATVNAPPEAPASFSAAINLYERKLDQFVNDVKRLKSVDDWGALDAATPAAFLPDYWKVDGTVRPDPGGLPAKYLSDEQCLAADPSDRCESVFGRAVALADEVFLVDELVSIMTARQRSNFAAEAASREARWHAYLYDAQFEYWWELALNRYAEVKCPRWLRWDCETPPRDKFDNGLGFRKPPNNKLMLLHPDVGLEYLNHEPAGQRLKPVLIFQWIGYQRWQWQHDAVSGLKGIAVVSSVADTASTKRFGNGLQLQWQKYAVAVTSHGGYVGVTISRSLIDQIQTVNPEWADKLRAPLPK
jgi:hypothetical protein